MVKSKGEKVITILLFLFLFLLLLLIQKWEKFYGELCFTTWNVSFAQL